MTRRAGVYVRALEVATGQPIENLGFQPADERYGLNRNEALGMAPTAALAVGDQDVAGGPLTGIWRSRYEYVSSVAVIRRCQQHYVVILHRGMRLQLRSLPTPRQAK